MNSLIINLNFKTQFIQPILDGKKIHTLRHGNNYRACQKVHFWADDECFARGRILFVYNKFMRVHRDGGITISNNGMVAYPGLLAMRGGNCMEYVGTYELAQNDGFSDFHEFLQFFGIQKPGEYQLILFEVDKE